MADTQHSLPQKLLAEFAGTFVVVLVAVNSELSRPSDIFVRGYNPLYNAISYGVAYGVVIAILGRRSGGYFNPAVTVAHWVTHRLGIFTSLLYIVAQLGGATAAAYALRFAWVAISNLPTVAELIRPPVLAAGVTRGPALLAEAAATAALVLALWATIVARERPRYWLGGLVAGAVLAAASYIAAPYTGGVLNPARAFGPALAARQWAYQPVYWIGPLAGAVVAASLYDLLFRRSDRTADPAVARGAHPPA